MADTIRGVCPQCGKKLEIPAELEEFSCLYCGARMRTEALRAKPMEERAVEALLAQLPGCITRYPDLHLRIGKKDFFPTFAQYEQDNAPLLQELDACCAGYPGGAEALAGHAAAVMLDGLAAHMEKDPRWGKRTRDNVFFDTKVALAIFFTPLLRKLQLELAEPLRTQLQTQWLARWPKQLWRPGDYMYVDNYYVKILTENGIVGVTAFGMMLLGLIGNGLRGCVRTAKTRWSPLCAGMLCGLVGVLLHSVFESIWEEPYMMALFFAVAAMMAWAGLLRRRAPEAV